jgi:hypothetical protein
MVIVAASSAERDRLRLYFPDAAIVVPGNQYTAPDSLDAVLVTPGVDVKSRWFGARIVTALREGGTIFEIIPRSQRPFYG